MAKMRCCDYSKSAFNKAQSSASNEAARSAWIGQIHQTDELPGSQLIGSFLDDKDDDDYDEFANVTKCNL